MSRPMAAGRRRRTRAVDPGQTGAPNQGSCAEGWQPCEGSCAPARPVEVTRLPGDYYLQAPAIDDRHFFVVATKLGVSGPEIWAASADGGEPVRLVSGPIAYLTADPSGLFYQTTNQLYRVPAAAVEAALSGDRQVRPELLASEIQGGGIRGIAVGGGFVYWATAAKGDVRRVRLGGGTVETRARLGRGARVVTADATQVFATAPDTDSTRILGLPHASVRATELARQPPSHLGRAMVSDGTHLYFVSLTTVLRVPVAGGWSATPVVACGSGVFELAVHDGKLYYLTQAGDLFRLPTTGSGAPVLVHHEQSRGGFDSLGLYLRRGSLFWTRDHVLRRRAFCEACQPRAACPEKACGALQDGCGGLLECGGCTEPETCGGGGTANLCGPALLDSGPVSLSAAEVLPIDTETWNTGTYDCTLSDWQELPITFRLRGTVPDGLELRAEIEGFETSWVSVQAGERSHLQPGAWLLTATLLGAGEGNWPTRQFRIESVSASTHCSSGSCGARYHLDGWEPVTVSLR